MKKKKIILTGGGSAGHVTPNLALIPKLKELGYEIQYIGTKDGIEKSIIENEKIKYHVISSGKLRRYFDIKNFTDPFKVLKGVSEAKEIIKKEKPNIVFSKGGFVSVPVVIGAYLNNIPVITHESDITPGLANKLSSPFCTKVCVTFPESLKNVKKSKGVLTGTPIREELFNGSKEEALKICEFKEDKPILLIIGGSLGSRFINDNVRNMLTEFLKEFNIIHVCGKGNLQENLKNLSGYRQFEYVKKELPHFMNGADIVISRAGANVIFELLALKKPNLLIPLSRKSSRGDQILNARSFEKSGYSVVIEEEELNSENLLNELKNLYKYKDRYIKAMNSSPVQNGVDNIIRLIEECSK
ncbi:UDP-N-acetylglucosamine--N-acetylmuramyl-(pentapeptide) pyrophosphoryl-undecaprenol N-acetylglucosamine transferase [Clostridium tetanomorphum]|uniref:undecaprenyldiphospho-muramoylpentapeptide beta-N-acetylglucosaminyltransferase n=1 Tax=Clostridium tetanomorphum TaxID=1553 RepID=UPI0004477793|nr:undecaprenyldiphospho-muramoylpentapeptide beta-N-acetylglucosaminyltransferase [Clostridium tetanomorphum]KAJ53479.1 undecaprenyldiphospho-muramoylpentapeptide beta-N- acetylglucosaminyltransferase [Clostridium tetanomorphum DSM 665]MBP1865290.1 UDP-N-acetylglucosamine--N-acetylmuramyl-(pentapeptide) pyrophosphoryl-undecaprenol N-acetylglucosamine transferase [Clostridium tetanomorphum]NRS85213.1 UDP-N-acetylglucosamine--N-acetylmuramyl-(pentapeptide) pyrophosphoryl-undecaprenol N-acetylgluc